MAEFDLSKFNNVGELTPTNIISEVICVEGGYVNHPHDKGGETCYGITKEVAYKYGHLWINYNWQGDMQNLPKALAYDIYYEGYWKASKCDLLSKIHPLLAFHFFDFAVNAGIGTPTKHLQRLLNSLNRKGKDYPDISVDGSLGIQTISTLEAFVRKNGGDGLKRLILGLVAMQISFYLQITEKTENYESFMNGWLRRGTSKLFEFSRLLK